MSQSILNCNYGRCNEISRQVDAYEATLDKVHAFFRDLISIARSSAIANIDTPFVLFDPSRVKNNIDSLRGINAPNSFQFRINFAVKALYMPDLLAYISQYINGFDVQSIRELELLPASAFITMHSPLLKEHDVLNDRINAITLNSLTQVQLIKKLKRIRDSYGIRVRAADYSEGRFINRDDKFGVDSNDLIESFNTIQKFSENAIYFHLHSLSRVSSQEEALSSIDSFSVDLLRFQERTGIDVQSINLGGGYNGAFEAYRNGGDIKGVIATQIELLRRKFHGITSFSIEPGRYLVEDSCVGIATINDVISRDSLTHVIVDIATSFLITVPLARFVCVPCEIKKSAQGYRKIVISDGTCSPRGQIVEIFTNLDFRIGDKVMFFNIGAYTFSLAGTFFSYLPDVYVVLDSKRIKQISLGYQGGRII